MRRELGGLSRANLLALAGAEGIRGRHRLSKAELVDALAAAYRRLANTPGGFHSLRRRDLELLAGALAIRRRSRLPKGELAEAVLARWAARPARGAARPRAAGCETTRLTLIPIDPYRIHAYWEILPADLEAARRALGEEGEAASTVLRVYDVTSTIFDGPNAWHTFDVEIGAATNWYLDLWSADKSLAAELGLRSGSGRFVPVARSNVVHTPRAGPSDQWDERWVGVEPEVPPLPERPGRGEDLDAGSGDRGIRGPVMPLPGPWPAASPGRASSPSQALAGAPGARGRAAFAPSPLGAGTGGAPGQATARRPAGAAVPQAVLAFDDGRVLAAQGEGAFEAPPGFGGPSLPAPGGTDGRPEPPGLAAWRSTDGTWVTSPHGPAAPSPQA